MNSEEMGNRIADLRKKKRNPSNPNQTLSQDKLAELMHTQQRTISNWENGRVGNGDKSEIQTLLKFCNLLGCSPDYLLGYSDTPFHIQGDLADATGLPQDAIDFLIGINNYRKSLDREGHKKGNPYAIDRAADYELIIKFIGYFIRNMDFDIMIRHIKAMAKSEMYKGLAASFSEKTDDERIEAALKNKTYEDKVFLMELVEEAESLTNKAVSNTDAADASAFRFSTMATVILDDFSKEHLPTARKLVEREVDRNEKR